MNIWKLLLILSSFFLPSSYAIETLIEGKVAYFRPTSDTFREIYDEGPIYGVEVSVQAYKQLYGWASTSLYTKSGKTLEGTSTDLLMVPIGTGLKYIHSFDKYSQIYLAGGILPTYINIEDKSPFLIPKSIGWGVGGQFKLGFLFNLVKGLFLDIFGDYIVLKKKFSNDPDILVRRTRTDFSALSIGGGLGYRF